jgi:ribosomal protein S18 acetylase RimI-like enzyme
MTASAATADDLERVLELVRCKRYPGSSIPGVTAERRQQSTMEHLQRYGPALFGNPRVSFLVSNSPAAYWLTIHGQADHASGQPESVLLDHAGDLSAYPVLYELSCRQARRAGDKYFAARLYPDEHTERGAFTALGLQPEFWRVVHPLRPRPARGSYEIRRVCEEDRVFLTRLTLESSSFYRSANRAGVENLAWSDMANYLSLDLSPDSDLAGWLAQDGAEKVGYVLLKRRFPVELLSDEAVYLYDIAIQPAHWGRGAGSQLHEHATNELLEMGVAVVVGDISCSNQRTFRIACDKLDYRLEWERWGLNL